MPADSPSSTLSHFADAAATHALAVVGTGVIGKEHIARIQSSSRARLAASVDPVGGEFATVEQMLARIPVDGAIIATPNPLHYTTALPFLERGIPVLIEKPLAGTLDDAARIVEAVTRTGTPALVGHHRRHSTILQAAQRAIAGGLLGELATLHCATLFHKPDAYFDVAWRTGPTGGPVLINLIHDVDSLRALAGEISSVHAVLSNRRRGLAVEDTAAVVLEFACGAVGTMLLCDAAVSTQSWEQTSGENPIYPRDTGTDCLFVAGTRGSLALPSLRLHTQAGTPSWTAPFQISRLEHTPADPLTRQLEHFCDVLDGVAAPLVTAESAMRTLAVTLRIREYRRVAPASSE